MDTFIIIDGNSLINRAFYALPPLSGKDGTPTQAVYGFVTMLIKLLDLKPGLMAVAFDLKAPTFRHMAYPQYKANRKGMPDELAVQLPIMKSLLAAMGIAVVEKEGYEADDIMGTMAARYAGPTYIVTGDRDSFQLIDDTTKVLFTKRGITETEELTPESLLANYSLTPSKVILYKALAGDTSDNIPGVPGVGAKTALALTSKYDSLDAIYADIDNIESKFKNKLIAGIDSAYMSYKLATIDRNVPDLIKAEDCRFTFPFGAQVREMFEGLNFKSLTSRDELFAPKEFVPSCVFPECRDVSLEEFCEAVSSVKDAVPFILESDGVSIERNGEGLRLPIRHTLVGDGAAEFEVAEAIKGLCEGDVLKVVFDAKALKKRLIEYGVELNNFFDVELCQYLVNAGADHSSIAALGKEYGFDGGQLLMLKRLYELVSEQLKERDMEKLYYELELPLVDVLFDMERTGFKVDRTAIDELSAKYGSKIAELQAEVIELAGHSFNINSPRQLATVLFEELKIPYPKKSKSYSTGADVLEPLKGNFPIVDKVLEYRFLTKLKSTYLDGLKPLLDSNDVVHTEFKQMLTATGRLSSVEPNLQNIPMRTEEGRKLRKLFMAKDGNVLVSADYSQIELRIMAHLSGDKKMVEAYNNGEDIHASTAAEIYGVPISQVTPAMRREAKTVNFGLIYGMSTFGLSESLGITPAQAGRYIKMYFERFSGVKQYLDDIVEFAKEKGYVETLLHRRRYIPELKSNNFNLRRFGERVARNTPLQGSAADIIKAAMIKVAARLKGKKSKLILQIHDELIVDAAIEEKDEVEALLVDCMENVIELKVPLKVEVGSGTRWYDCK